MPRPLSVPGTLVDMPQHPSLAIDSFVRSLGGIATRQQLLDHGVSVRAIAWAVGNGVLDRVRRAWYSVPDADRERVLAVMLGGRLGGMSAARSYGLWTGLDDDLHVSWAPHGNIAKPGRAVVGLPGRPPDDLLDRDNPVVVVTHWRLERFADPHRTWRESLPQTLAQVVLTASFRDAVACCDSAVNSKLLSTRQIRRLIGSLPTSVHAVGRAINGSAGSGLETYVRLWLDDEGCDYRTQVQVGPYRLDFLIGTSLVLETDGEQFHSDAAKFEADRVMNAYLQTRGYTVIRLTYRMVLFAWLGCELLIRREMARGRHLDDVL